ncbi:MAG: hypothetical protein NZT61_07795, partial [Deltaproteobacteria bacterium]|nr:hypothetical protein [Deltaproteobacteria bacterium]
MGIFRREKQSQASFTVYNFFKTVYFGALLILCLFCEIDFLRLGIKKSDLVAQNADGEGLYELIERVVEQVAEKCFPLAKIHDFVNDSSDPLNLHIDCEHTDLENPKMPFVFRNESLTPVNITCRDSYSSYHDCFLGEIRVQDIVFPYLSNEQDEELNSNHESPDISQVLRALNEFTLDLVKNNKMAGIDPLHRMEYVFNNHGGELLNFLSQSFKEYKFEFKSYRELVVTHSPSNFQVVLFPREIFISTDEKVFILNEIAAGTFYHKLSSGRIIKIYLPKVIGILESRLKGAKINQARLDT